MEMRCEELQEILRLHDLWTKNEKGGVRADLLGADLLGANLRGANLSCANLRGADLYDTDLCEPNPRGANLCYADLRGADLYDTDLRGAGLHGANLFGTKNLSVVSAGPFGRDDRITYYKHLIDEVDCGCFRGTLDEFAAKVEETHKDNPVRLAEYRAAIELFRAVAEARAKRMPGGKWPTTGCRGGGR